MLNFTLGDLRGDVEWFIYKDDKNNLVERKGKEKKLERKAGTRFLVESGEVAVWARVCQTPTSGFNGTLVGAGFAPYFRSKHCNHQFRGPFTATTKDSHAQLLIMLQITHL